MSEGPKRSKGPEVLHEQPPSLRCYIQCNGKCPPIAKVGTVDAVPLPQKNWRFHQSNGCVYSTGNSAFQVAYTLAAKSWLRDIIGFEKHHEPWSRMVNL